MDDVILKNELLKRSLFLLDYGVNESEVSMYPEPIYNNTKERILSFFVVIISALPIAVPTIVAEIWNLDYSFFFNFVLIVSFVISTIIYAQKISGKKTIKIILYIILECTGLYLMLFKKIKFNDSILMVSISYCAIALSINFFELIVEMAIDKKNNTVRNENKKIIDEIDDKKQSIKKELTIYAKAYNEPCDKYYWWDYDTNIGLMKKPFSPDIKKSHEYKRDREVTDFYYTTIRRLAIEDIDKDVALQCVQELGAEKQYFLECIDKFPNSKRIIISTTKETESETTQTSTERHYLSESEKAQIRDSVNDNMDLMERLTNDTRLTDQENTFYARLEGVDSNTIAVLDYKSIESQVNRDLMAQRKIEKAEREYTKTEHFSDTHTKNDTLVVGYAVGNCICINIESLEKLDAKMYRRLLSFCANANLKSIYKFKENPIVGFNSDFEAQIIAASAKKILGVG